MLISFQSILFLLVSTTMLARTAPVLRKRGGEITRTGRATFFHPGVGACGGTNSDDDHIVAINTDTFQGFPGAGANPNDNSICGKQVEVTFNGNSVSVTVVDECPSCGPNDIDLSPSAFSVLASQDLGEIQATWKLPE